MLTQVTKRLADPPIVEVVCGFFFQPVRGLDPLVVGKYWAERKERRGFPKKQLHPPVTEQPGLFLGDGVGPLRTWLVSEGDEYVLQIQPDRFYFNWRNREGKYPHFNDYDDQKGVLSRGLTEYAEFAEFVKGVLHQEPGPTALELTKIDLLRPPKYWADYADLAKVVPMLGTLPKITDDPAVNLSLVGERNGFNVHFRLATSVLASDLSLGFQMETRVTATQVGSTMAERRNVFQAMNTVANEIFFETISPDQLGRFGGLA